VYWRYFNSTQQTAASAPAPLLGALQSPTSRPAPLFAMPNGQAGTPAASHTTAARASAVDPHSVTSSIPIIGATANQLSASRATAAQAADDLGDDEVAAFRRALAAGASQGAMAAAAPKAAPAAKAPAMPAPPPASSTRPLAAKPIAPASTLETARSKLLLTGYEDTEMADDDPLPALSGTQYGELR
jgi:pyruvate dehydrogenase E2 component (dihydrolipoamide acetyltransferase)